MGWGAMKGIGGALQNIGNKLMDDNLARMREERLRKYQEEDRDIANAQQNKRDAENRAFQTEERIGSQAFQSSENEAQRAAQSSQWEADHELRKQQMEAATQQIDMAVETGQLALEEARELKSIRDVLLSDEATDVERDAAKQKLRDLKGSESSKYEFFTAFESTVDSFGDPVEVKRTYRGDTITGTYEPIGTGAFDAAPAAGNGIPEPQSQQEYDALPAGTRYRHPDGTIKVKK